MFKQNVAELQEVLHNVAEHSVLHKKTNNMRKENENMSKIEENGITLIALIITIIILVILAAVSINAAYNSGIINYAVNGTGNYIEGTNREKENLNTGEDNFRKQMAQIEATIGGVSKVNDANPGTLEVDSKNANILYINSMEDLVSFSKNVNEGNNYAEKMIKLNCNLDFQSNNSYVNPDSTDYDTFLGGEGLKNTLTTGEGFIPIGNEVTIIRDEDNNVTGLSGNYFSGTFDGNGYYIVNLYENRESNKGGLFGMTLDAIIKNVYLHKGTINITKPESDDEFDYLFIGGIVGYQYSGRVEGCTVNIEITGRNTEKKSFIGGVVGALAPITDEVVSSGVRDGSFVINCIHKGNVTSSANTNISNSLYIGGVLGQTTRNSYVMNCENRGNVEVLNYGVNSSNVSMGGCIGMASFYRTIKNLQNNGNIIHSGDIDGRLYVGGVAGLIGVTSFSSVEECTNVVNIGNISVTIGNGINNTKSYVGGLFGFIERRNLCKFISYR